MYIAKFVFDPNVYDVSIISQALREIRLKDSTFKYMIVALKDGKCMLKIYNQTLDQAHKRALWIRSKLFNNEVGYKVEER